jgi:putative tryptophan/tyrosine transport system substrate-binding protein
MRSLGSRSLLALLLAAAGIAILFAGCGSSGDGGSSGSSESDRKVTVGVFELANAEVIEETVAAFEEGMRKQLAPREVDFDVKNAQEETSLIQSISREFSESDDDMFAVIGTPAVVALAQEEPERPIIALAMGDPVGAKVAKSLAEPGTNVTGSIDYIEPELLLEQIERIAPTAKTIGTVYDPSNENSAIWVKSLGEAIEAEPGMKLDDATIGSSADISAAALSVAEGSDAFIVGPDAKVVSGLPAVISATGDENEPLYVVAGDPSVEGVFATLGPSYPTLGRESGELAAKIAAGEAEPETTAFIQPAGAEWGINPKTMETLGVQVPAAILKQAGVK